MTRSMTQRTGDNVAMSSSSPIDTVVSERYRLERALGTGGMASVYLAHDVVLDRRVAIKVLHSQHAIDEQFVQRFEREATAVASLNHPNIVQVYDRGQDSNPARTHREAGH
ncbi:MAG: Tyrosine protein kinase:Serine/threonine protein kinase:PASTA [Thermoleophilia bacterium]|jgi:serine/threonine protein kinase|nr:Tyrosine protein kinase:Serine/threonine protein kinase:PASTA [Thermoleophilia bacterium]